MDDYGLCESVLLQTDVVRALLLAVGCEVAIRTLIAGPILMTDDTGEFENRQREAWKPI